MVVVSVLRTVSVCASPHWDSVFLCFVFVLFMCYVFLAFAGIANYNLSERVTCELVCMCMCVCV